MNHPDGFIRLINPSPRFLAKFLTEEDGMAAVLSINRKSTIPPEVTGIEIVDETAVPTDLTFCAAWKKVPGGIEVNMDKARPFVAERIEKARQAKLRGLLVREVLGEDVSAEKARLRAIRPGEVVKDARMPEDLKALLREALDS